MLTLTREFHGDDREHVAPMLQELRLPYMAADYETKIKDQYYMSRISDDPIQLVRDLVENEHWRRIEQQLNNMQKKADLRYPEAAIDDSINDPERNLDTHLISMLEKCDWIFGARDLIVTGMTGTGKTYISNALLRRALEYGLAGRYVRAGTILHELEAADTLGNLPDKLVQISKFDLLVIDDFGLMKLDLDKCRNLFELIDSRTGRHSTVLVSQIPVSEWYDLFSNATYADAVLDRLTHQAYRLEMNGPSMRRKDPPPPPPVSDPADVPMTDAQWDARFTFPTKTQTE